MVSRFLKETGIHRGYKHIYQTIQNGAKVLDVGCTGFRQVAISREIGFSHIRHFGVDFCEPADNVPEGVVFRQANLNKQPIPFKDDFFDLVIASHVIEHLAKPVEFFGECVRVCKPDGIIYIEAPSERSLFLPGMPFDYDRFCSLSFFDDPTHISRPWTPQAFYRLAKYFSCEPIDTRRLFSWKIRLLFPMLLLYALLTRNGKYLEGCCWRAFGWSCYLIARKPLTLRGKPNLNYYIPIGK